MIFVSDIIDFASEDISRSIPGNDDILLRNGGLHLFSSVDRDEAKLKIDIDLVLQTTRYPDCVGGCLCRTSMADAPVVVFTLHTHRQWEQSSFDSIKAGLFAQMIVDDCPRCCRPAIVELPDQSTTASPTIAPLTPPSTVCISQRLALRQLGQIRPGLEADKTECQWRH
ncbi:hypothetical protein HG530_008509 [Fusarium avenaceum]|nr:hypothetical protein HG530_008509 [Fusarium avenaceum]